RGAIEGVYPVFKEAVYRAVYGIDPTSPEDAVKGVSGAFLRDEILKHSLDDLYDYSAADMPKTRGNVIEAIEGAVQPRLAEILEDWGLKLLGVDISTVEMPEDIKAKVLQWWATAWESERLGVQAEGERHAMAERGRGQAQALTAVEEEKARIGQQLIHNLISTLSGATINLNPLIAARILKLLEVLLARMACDSVTALRQLDTLEKLLEGEGSKTLVIGEPPSMLLRGEEKT
ncbi:MAG: hypothetical protein FJY85_25380, partial [Deltaproteobacteria bacterium]|nr:hypothetical protein [Deltaproteobacteria bacterium]